MVEEPLTTEVIAEMIYAAPALDLEAAHLFINRELSLLRFNARVLAEGLDEHRHPLLERVKFLSIFSNNMDEFFMTRVSGLCRQVASGVVEAPPDGMSPAEQLAAIRLELLPVLIAQMQCWCADIVPKLQAAGINILNYDQLRGNQRKLLRRHFEREIFPVLTPLAFDPGHPFPHISNLSINLAVVINDPIHGQRFARLKIPGTFPRLLRIPEEAQAESYETLGLKAVVADNFVWIEEVVIANLDKLFPGLEVVAAYPFRVTRDADLEIEEDEAADLLEAIEESVGMRQFGLAVRLEVDKNMPEQIRDILVANLSLASYLVYTADGPIGLSAIMELTGINRPDLKDLPFIPYTSRAFSEDENLFATIKRRKNFLLYHPYDSFAPVVDFLRAAANDLQVLAIKQTLYRVGRNSPVVDALLEAREHGKQVAVLVELKARFDEENNIVWAKALERAGVHVIYGLMGLKTHAKMCLVVRREPEGMMRYVHLATGNYNAVTARIYTDIGYFTCDPAIGTDVSDLFNALTGYSRKDRYAKLIVAPMSMREQILERIDREIAQHQRYGNGYLAFKMNQLVDKVCIQALYRASQAGVRVDLQVRGVCCIRPGIPGISESITVTSVVGRFLEHTRIFYFYNNGEEEMLLGSADLMPRNLDRRVETLFPLDDPLMLASVRDNILKVHLRDNMQCHQLMSDGAYRRLHPEEGQEVWNTQLWMLRHRGVWDLED
ncbi:MAG TPA: polyphosphate kinase 1 [Anaerolineae bacterium]|nr:polyphosphate kinase 1 [Anaerolineae bacterium]